MLKQLSCYCQYILPQHWLSTLAGKLANSENIWLKNKLIKFFCWQYTINLSEAAIEDPLAYKSFNHFFTRALKDGARPINRQQDGITSPADGTLAQHGHIHQHQLLQAKDMYFNVSSLLGGNTELADRFDNGHYATIYLAPHDYHRVHMPISGKLSQSIYIPGSLFSVNTMTSELIPNLYARNERLVLIFETEFGPVAVILVGALIVGSIQTVWMDKPIRSDVIEVTMPDTDISLEKGAELGHFQLGSTVILLLPSAHPIKWDSTVAANKTLLTGQLLGSLSNT